MTGVSKNGYLKKFPIVNNPINNTINRKNKMKPVNLKPDTYIDFPLEFNTKRPT